MFQVSDPSTLQVFRMLYIHWRGFSLVVCSHILFVHSFQQFYQFLFLFRHSKKCNFLPSINFSKIEVIFCFIEVWWRKLQCSTSIFSTTYHFYSPMYGERSRDIQFLAGIPKFHNPTFHLFYSFLEQFQFVICSPFPKGLLQNLEWRVNVACTLGHMQSPLLFEILCHIN